MIALPPEPSAKDPISATFMKALMRCIRANTLLNGPGYRTKRGPNGTTLEIDKPKPGVSAAKIPGCWEIVKDTSSPEDSGEVTVHFKNRYFTVGGKTYSAPQEPINLPSPGIIYIDIELIDDAPVASIGTASDINAIPRDDDGRYAIPLYEFDENGSVVCDFRTIPTASAWEMLS